MPLAGPIAISPTLQQANPHHGSPTVAANSACKRASWSGGNCPPATVSTFSESSHWSVTSSKCANAFFASASTSVVGLNIPARFISAAADFTAASAPDTPGTYLKCEIATVLSSGFDAKYFFSTDILAAARGFASTHFAPLNNARVAAAAALGFFAKNFPFTKTAQQYSSL